jgi:hypothetical protein
MDFKFPYKLDKPENLIRRCGYAKIVDFKTDEISYVRRLSSGFYPRFHVYIQEFEKYFEVSLHLDQKKVSYEGQRAHSGEYDGPAVKTEAQRITAQIADIYGIKL